MTAIERPSRPTPRRAAVACTVLLVAVAIALTGCSSDGGSADAASAASSTTAPEAPTSVPPAEGLELAWDVSLSSQQRILQQVGPGGELNYGWNQLVGPSELDGQAIQVEMLGNVDYQQGSGPFFGFVTLTWPSGDVLGFRMDGQAIQPPGAQGSSDSSFTAELTVIGGTGAYQGATGGRGTFTGSRSAQLGGQVVGSMTATVAGL